MSLFQTNADVADALASFKADWLLHAANTYMGGVLPSDAFLTRKLQAAELTIQRRLGIPLTPTLISCDELTASEIADLSGAPYRIEPGYDLPPDFFGVQTFGALLLRVRPVIAIESIRIVYPSTLSQLFEIPHNWIRLDKKYGQVRIVPGPGYNSAPVSVFMMQAMGSGATIPHMIRVRYRAGIDDSSPDYLDVRSAVFQQALIDVITAVMPPQSGSISADGLSQSFSSPLKDMAGTLDGQIALLKESILGPVWGVL